jgi:hypothetical protein
MRNFIEQSPVDLITPRGASIGTVEQQEIVSYCVVYSCYRDYYLQNILVIVQRAFPRRALTLNSCSKFGVEVGAGARRGEAPKRLPTFITIITKLCPIHGTTIVYVMTDIVQYFTRTIDTQVL